MPIPASSHGRRRAKRSASFNSSSPVDALEILAQLLDALGSHVGGACGLRVPLAAELLAALAKRLRNRLRLSPDVGRLRVELVAKLVRSLRAQLQRLVLRSRGCVLDRSAGALAHTFVLPPFRRQLQSCDPPRFVVAPVVSNRLEHVQLPRTRVPKRPRWREADRPTPTTSRPPPSCVRSPTSCTASERTLRPVPVPKGWPRKSNPVCLGSYVSRAEARREIAGFRPGFWPRGQ